MKKNSVLLVLALCFVMLFSCGVLAADEEPVFSDVGDHWAKDAIDEMYTYGIVKGYEDGTYRPGNIVTRAEFAVMLDRVLTTPVKVSADDAVELPFTDVPKDHWAYSAILNLWKLGVVNGVSETSFAPNTPILRQDMAKLLYEADLTSEDLELVVDQGKNIAKFNDVGDISKYAVDGMTYAYQTGVFNGDTDNMIRPLDSATRAEAAQVLFNTIDAWQNPPLPVAISQDDWADHKQSVEIASGIEMYYVEMGNRDGEPLVLVHGASDSSRSWSLIAPYFADYHIYIPEMRAHGDTETGGIARIEQGLLGYDVVCFLDAVGLDRVNLVGHSRGSMIAQLVALNYPERISRVVFESAPAVSGNTPADQRDQTYFEDPFTSLPITGEYEGFDDYMDWWYYNDAPVDEDFISMAKYEASWLPLEAWRSIGGSLAEPQDLKDIPAMVIYGEEDYLMGKSVRDDFVEAYGDSVEYICHAGYGHNLHWENPEMISEEILDFFDRTEAAEIAPPADYPVAEKNPAPVQPTGMDPAPYFDKDGRLKAQLSEIPQGDWVNFKHYVELESGITMAYIEMGNPEGEPLLLLHGMTDSSRSWSTIVEYFADDYHLYIPDQRGHGDTDKPDMKKYDRSVFSWDIACFMDAMGLEKASVMGHSMGSFNTQAFAMDYPERVDKIILESTNMVGTNSADPNGAYSEYDPDSPLNAGKSESEIVTWDFIEWWYYNTIPVPEVFHQMVMADCYHYPLETWQVQFPASYQARILANNDIDVLVLYGGSDFLINPSTQDVVKQQMTEAGVNYQHITFTNRGHNLHWEEPAQISEDVKAFLNGTLDPSITEHEYEPFV